MALTRAAKDMALETLRSLKKSQTAGEQLPCDARICSQEDISDTEPIVDFSHTGGTIGSCIAYVAALSTID